MKRIFTLVLVVFLVFLVASCGNDKKKDVVKEKVTQQVSSEEGATVKTSDESVAIDIPSGALEGDTTITVTVYESSHHATAEGEQVMSQVVEFEPSGTVFKKPVIIKMKTTENIKNKVVTAAVYNEAKGEWSYSEHGAYAVLMGQDAAGDPIMQSAAGDPIMLNAAGDPIMMSAAGDPIMMSAAGDPIMLASAGDPIMTNAAGDPIMTAAAGDPIMMTTGHFTAYTFIALDPKNPVEEQDDADDKDDDDNEDKDDVDDVDDLDDVDDANDADEDIYVPECGNGIVEEGEACDDGNNEDGDYCSADCKTVTGKCGDGEVQDNEECDEAADNGKTDCAYNQTECTVCTTLCKRAEGSTSFCGDENVDSANGEQCDNGDANGATECGYGETNCTVCTTDCHTKAGKASYCGDGIVDEIEDCDDGAENGTYGHCNADCNGLAPRCGDDYLDEEYGEACDDGALNGSYGYCNTTCSGPAAHCGDGNIDTANGEVCDNGDANGATDCAYGETSCTVCSWNCQPDEGFASYCGDGLVDEDHGEACDDAADNGRTDCAYGYESCTVCTSSCQIASGETSYCGDGITDSEHEEECDNGSDNGRNECAYGEKSCMLCTTYCTNIEGATSFCGDGDVDEEHGEVCDHGDDNGKTDCAYGDESCTVCTTACQPAEGATSFCGDGRVDSSNGENCDNGAENGETLNCAYGDESCTLCNGDCQPFEGGVSYCGDGKIDEANGEVCDKADPQVGDGYGTGNRCSDDCKTDCLEHAAWNGTECVPDTMQAECGDLPENAVWNHTGTITQTWSGEAWLPSVTPFYSAEPGQTADCSFKCAEDFGWNEIEAECRPYCGNGAVDTDRGEVCDDGDDNGTYGHCDEECSKIVWCGDGIVQEDFEACDEGAYNGSYNHCNQDCSAIIECGDGILNGDEVCDDGPNNGEYGFCYEGCGKCDDEFHVENGHCVSNAGEYTECEGTLPDYAEWVNNTYYSHWMIDNGGYWYVAEPTYSEDEYVDCSFKCLEGFEWNENLEKCECPQDRPLNTDDPDNPYCALQGENVRDCNAKPDNSVWTDNGQHGQYIFSMTYQVTTQYAGGDTCDCCFDCEEGYHYLDDNGQCEQDADPCEELQCEGIDNSDGSCAVENGEPYCGCIENYEWNMNEYICAPATQLVECDGLPANASYNFSGYITQTWNGEYWYPAADAFYSEDMPPMEDCSFQCIENFYWNGQTNECLEMN